MNPEHRETLRGWSVIPGPTGGAIRAALDEIDRQAAQLVEVPALIAERNAAQTLASERLSEMCRLAKVGNEQAEELALLRRVATAVLAKGLADCERFPLAQEWRKRFGKGD